MTTHLPADFGRLIHGAVDAHVHGQPDLARALENRGDDLAVATLAADYGLRGMLLKSHLWPTTDRAGVLQRAFDPARFAVLGSITLNPPAGGLSSASVELAAAHGARLVFLPTWGAAADVARDGYVSRLLRGIVRDFDAYAVSHAIRVADESGRLVPAAADILAVCRDRGVAIGTGHVSAAESLAVAERAAELGVPVVVNHPLHYVEHAADLRAYTALGAFVEFSAGPLLHPDSTSSVREVRAAIAEVGADGIILSSDVFSRWAPTSAEALRIVAEQLAYLGVTAAELRTMLVENPSRLLGVPPAPPLPAPSGPLGG